MAKPRPGVKRWLDQQRLLAAWMREGRKDGVMGRAMAGVWLAALLCAGASLSPLRAKSTTPQQVPPAAPACFSMAPMQARLY